MPYEFNCKYCDARIRVRDNAGGGKGRCPKCGIRITVPKKSSLKLTAKSQVPDEPFVLPDVFEATDVTSVPLPIFDNPPIEPDSSDIIFGAAGPEDPRIGEFPIEASPSPKKIKSSRSKKHKLKYQTVIISGMFALAIMAVAAIFLVPVLLVERLKGNITAQSAVTLELPPVLIERSRINVAPEDLTVLLKKLEAAPLPMTSSSMQIQLTGTPKGLQISVAAGIQSHFYRVNLSANGAVKKYLANHQAELEERRTKEIDRKATEFFLEYQKVLAKKSPAESLSAFRDDLAIPALVQGFGNQLVAARGRGIYRCIYEDHDGGLYFLIPAGTKEFELRGREDADGRVAVAVEFKVNVKGEISSPKKSDEQGKAKSNPESPSISDQKERESEDKPMTGKN